MERAKSTNYCMESSKRFLLPASEREYQRQFYHVYRKRLEALRVRVEAAARDKLAGTSFQLLRGLCDLEEATKAAGSADDGDEAGGAEGAQPKPVVVVVGTVFKSGEHKPSILKQLCVDEHEEQDVPDKACVPSSFVRYIGDKDELVLEDETQRIRLVGDGIRADRITSGVICGVYGHQEGSGSKGGKFLVKGLIFPKYERDPAATVAPRAVEPGSEDRFVVLVSGLELSGQSSGSFLPLSTEMFCQWILGEMGSEDDQEVEGGPRTAARVERVVVAGNSLADSARADREAASGRARYLSRGQEAGSIEAVQALDKVLAQLCRSVPVDLMAGCNDPTGQMLPQQPMHRCLFPSE